MNEEETKEGVSAWTGYCLNCNQVIKTPLLIRVRDDKLETTLDWCPECACAGDKVLLIGPVMEKILGRLEILEHKMFQLEMGL